MKVHAKIAVALVVVPALVLVVIVIMTGARHHAQEEDKGQRSVPTIISHQAVENVATTRTSRYDLLDVVIPPKGHRFYAADTIMVTRASLKSIIYANADEAGSESPAYRYADALLFSHTNELSLTEVYQRLFDVCVTGQSSSAYHDALIALRFKAIVPIARDSLATWKVGDNIDGAYTSLEILHRLQHPDSMRAMLWLDNVIPADSPLCQGKRVVWWDTLPIETFYRDDCLEVW